MIKYQSKTRSREPIKTLKAPPMKANVLKLMFWDVGHPLLELVMASEATVYVEGDFSVLISLRSSFLIVFIAATTHKLCHLPIRVALLVLYCPFIAVAFKQQTALLQFVKPFHPFRSFIDICAVINGPP